MLSQVPELLLCWPQTSRRAAWKAPFDSRSYEANAKAYEELACELLQVSCATCPPHVLCSRFAINPP